MPLQRNRVLIEEISRLSMAGTNKNAGIFFAVALRKKGTVVLYCSAISRSFMRLVEYTEGNSVNNLFRVTSGRDLNKRFFVG